MIQDLQNPFRRAFLLASIEEIEDDNTIQIKFFDNWFKVLYDHIADMADLIGTSNVNAHRGKGQRALKSLFQRRRRLMDRGSGDEDARFVPGVGNVRIVPNEDWD